MTRFFLPSFVAITAALTTFITAADARTPVSSVKAAVTVHNAAPGWSLSVRLAPGTRVQSVSGGTANGRRGTIVVKPKRSTLAVVIRGAKQPRSWRAGTTSCAVKPAGRRGAVLRLTVTCDVPVQHATGHIPGPPAAGGTTTPAGSATPSENTTPAADATPTPSATPTPTATPEPATPYRFAPYVDFAGYPLPDLALTRTNSGADHISLGFVVQSTAGGCVPTWGGYDAYPASGTDARGRSDVLAFRQGGGDVVPSFGGAAGTELALACTTVSQLQAAYQSVIDTYGATHVDFDIEGTAIGNATANTRRAQAIAGLQAANPGLVVTYTLPTDPTGLDAAGVALLQNAIDNGVAVHAVNIMAMDYTGVANPSGHMGDNAIQAGTSLYNQLTTLLPSRSAAQRWAMVGITPMIGINDYSDQIFSLNDASKLVAWASSHHIGMLGMWALERDNQCPAPVTTAQLKCSGVTQNPYAFASTLGAY